MVDIMHELYRLICGSGQKQPTIRKVMAALGTSSPCEALLYRWRRGEAVPPVEQLLLLLAMAGKNGPLPEGFEARAQAAWWAWQRAHWRL